MKRLIASGLVVPALTLLTATANAQGVCDLPACQPSCAAPSCAAPVCQPSCAAPVCQPTCAAPACNSCDSGVACRPTKVVNIHINFCKGDKTKVKRNVVLGALGDFAGGGTPPASTVLSTATVQNVQFPAIPIAVMTTQATTVAPANAQAAGANGNSTEMVQLQDDVSRLTKLVDRLVTLEKARSEAALNAVEAAK